MSQNENTSQQPFFHSTDNFSSAYFGQLPEFLSKTKRSSEDQKLVSHIISLLIDPSYRELRTETLATIRNTNAQQFLVDLIAMKEYEQHKKQLVAACWESGLDYSAHLIFFTNLVVKCEYPVAMEALTVIDEMHNLRDNPDVNAAIDLLTSDSLSPDKQLLAKDTINKLRSIVG